MMQAGKDYVTKGEPEYESPRAAYLRDLLKAVNAPAGPPERQEVPAEAAAVNQTKPTLKLSRAL